MVFSGSQWFFSEAISIKGAIEIMLLPESLFIHTCELPFADQIFTFLY